MSLAAKCKARCKKKNTVVQSNSRSCNRTLNSNSVLSLTIENGERTLQSQHSNHRTCYMPMRYALRITTCGTRLSVIEIKYVRYSMSFLYVDRNHAHVHGLGLMAAIITRHRARTSTRWHFAFGLCCHSNETPAPIANPPNNAQLGGNPYHSKKSHPGPCSNGGIRRGTDTHLNTKTAMATIHFASSRTRAKCNKFPARKQKMPKGRLKRAHAERIRGHEVWNHFPCVVVVLDHNRKKSSSSAGLFRN